MEKPSIGDTVIIKGVVKSFSSMGASAHIDTGNGHIGLLTCSVERIAEVIPKPWEPKVGDKVRVRLMDRPYHLLGTVGETTEGRPEWAVVGLLTTGDPFVRRYTDLREL